MVSLLRDGSFYCFCLSAELYETINFNFNFKLCNHRNHALFPEQIIIDYVKHRAGVEYEFVTVWKCLRVLLLRICITLLPRADVSEGAWKQETRSDLERHHRSATKQQEWYCYLWIWWTGRTRSLTVLEPRTDAVWQQNSMPRQASLSKSKTWVEVDNRSYNFEQARSHGGAFVGTAPPNFFCDPQIFLFPETFVLKM